MLRETDVPHGYKGIKDGDILISVEKGSVTVHEAASVQTVCSLNPDGTMQTKAYEVANTPESIKVEAVKNFVYQNCKDTEQKEHSVEVTLTGTYEEDGETKQIDLAQLYGTDGNRITASKTIQTVQT